MGHYDIHSLVGIPTINYGNYWKKRQELIEEYNKDVKNLKDLFEVKSLELYWKFYFQHLQLSAQRDFNTEVNRWLEKMEDLTPKQKESTTQTLPTLTVVIRPQQPEQTQLVPVRPRFIPIQPKPVETVTINKVLHGSQPSISMGKRYIFHLYPPPQQPQPARAITPLEHPHRLQHTRRKHQENNEERNGKWKIRTTPIFRIRPLLDRTQNHWNPIMCCPFHLCLQFSYFRELHIYNFRPLKNCISTIFTFWVNSIHATFILDKLSSLC